MVVVTELPPEESSSSSSTPGYRYDVFVSFRGFDTRASFVAYLYHALIDANITAFLDDEELPAGEDLRPELEFAIKTSRASIIVLSKNFAYSTWCLNELVLILEQHRTSNHIVFPIFYRVEPRDVRQQNNSFGAAMLHHNKRMKREKNTDKRSKLAQRIDRWKQALTEVANLTGWAISDRTTEMERIADIVNVVYRTLQISSKFRLPHLIGMNNSIIFVTLWLQDESIRKTSILTILGMGGMGKSSLAKYVYVLESHRFDASSFVEDISVRCEEKSNGLLDAQKQLYDDISKPKSNQVQVHNVDTYTSMIQNIVTRKKVLLVLDDIGTLKQLDALLGSTSFHPESKIIITTKKKGLTQRCSLFKMIKPTYTEHKLEGVSKFESRKLLCFHAFISNDPKEGYEEASEKAVEYCEGHPMALTILGRSLHDREVAYWEGYIDKLKKENDSPINSVLKMSFNSLPSPYDQDLFKHIACIFVGMDRDVTVTILEACRIETKIGITNLIEKFLLSIGWNNKLVMHQLVQEMGRFVVREESPKLWKRSLLWGDDSLTVLKGKKGTENVVGLTLDMGMPEKEKLCAPFELKTNALSKMDCLKLLQLNYVKINGSYEDFPQELRWLCMHGFLLEYIPLDLPMENLVALDMSYSKIASFGICCSNSQQLQKRQKEDKRLSGALKILNLSFCEQLRSLGGFHQLPALERLIVRNCINLFEICESIEQCSELVLVDLSYCRNLDKISKFIGMLKKVQTLLVDGCNLGGYGIEIRDMDSPEKLNANDTCMSTITSTTTVIEAIPKFLVIPLRHSLVTLSLADNNLSIESFPKDFKSLYMLKELILDKNPIICMPNCVTSLPKLKILSMQDCTMLASIEHPPHALTYLNLQSDSKLSLQSVVFDTKMSSLDIYIEWKMLLPSLHEFEGLVKIQPMTCVEENVLCRLGWNKLDIIHERGVLTSSHDRTYRESEIQMYYEFGIFSTIYGGEEMPSWITDRTTDPSISFTIPSSANNLVGLNFCYVQMSLDVEFQYLPVIIIINETKNCTWIYDHYIDGVLDIGGKFFTFLSHWMFRKNEMEGGDHIIITVRENKFHAGMQGTLKCGMSLVYDDGDRDGEEEDALSYYKSWNHIIGGDLTGFQLTTGEYILNKSRSLVHDIDSVLQTYRYFCGESAIFKEKQVHFRAFSQTESGRLEDAPLGRNKMSINDVEERDETGVRTDTGIVPFIKPKTRATVETGVDVVISGAELMWNRFLGFLYFWKFYPFSIFTLVCLMCIYAFLGILVISFM